MAAPNLISTRRLPGSVRMRLQVVFARAWEALAETYQMQAVEFVRRLRGRLPFDEALDRYFREIGVPAAMVDTVRARALIAMAEMLEEEGEPEHQDATEWHQGCYGKAFDPEPVDELKAKLSIGAIAKRRAAGKASQARKSR